MPRSRKNLAQIFCPQNLEAVKLLLRTGGLERTQKSISDDLMLAYPEHGVSPRIWQRVLPAYEWKAIQNRVRGDLGGNGDVRGCKTLSDIRKKLITIQQKNTGQIIYNAKAVITQNKVIVGTSIYPIELKNSGNYSYQVIRLMVNNKRQTIRVDALETILGSQ